jgi:phosphonopyruvate decarboxylase
MINVETLLNLLNKKKINFFTGVPDSVLKQLSKKIDKFTSTRHKMAVNEGSAVGIGIGHYLSTKKMACVYMQNSGLGNAINPLISIAHQKVYSIPLLLLIGWRGAPSQNDEPQHKVKGKITPRLLKLLNIEYCILKNQKDLQKLDGLITKGKKDKKVIACLIEKNILNNVTKLKKKIYSSTKKYANRKIFIKHLLKSINKKTKIISTTGHTSRELMLIRNEMKLNKGQDFYMVGGMGHALSVATGMSLQSNKQIICLDGDGSLLMHLGSMFTAGFNKKIKLKHILLNNNSHESVGGQITNAKKINFKNLSTSLGYKYYYKIQKDSEIRSVLMRFLKKKGCSFLEVRVNTSLNLNLPRPKNLIRIKNAFLNQ